MLEGGEADAVDVNDEDTQDTAPVLNPTDGDQTSGLDTSRRKRGREVEEVETGRRTDVAVAGADTVSPRQTVSTSTTPDVEKPAWVVAAEEFLRSTLKGEGADSVIDRWLSIERNLNWPESRVSDTARA